MTIEKTIARTILAQIGGVKARAMLGAKTAVAGDNWLELHIPLKAGGVKWAANGANRIRITLEDDDTYAVIFSVLRGVKLREISRHEGIFFDMLNGVIKAETGLDTRMPTVRMAS